MKIFLLITFIMILPITSIAQNSKDVIEKGIVIPSRSKVFVRFDTDKIFIDIGQNPTDYILIPDSSMLLSKRHGVNIYSHPLNPLNYSYDKSAIVFTVDPISELVSSTFDEITGTFSFENLVGSAKRGEPVPESFTGCSEFEEFKDTYNALLPEMENSRKNEIKKQFKRLKSLSFNDEGSTIKGIASIEKDIKKIKDEFDARKNKIDSLKVKLKKVKCNTDVSALTFVLQQSFKELHNAISKTHLEQYKRYENLDKALQLVKGVATEASIVKGGVSWLLRVTYVSIQKGHISHLTVSSYESGFMLSDKDEIVEIVKKEVVKRHLRFRAFQRFIPEVAGGVAYSDIDFIEYATDIDVSGNSIVVESGNQNFKRLTFNAMLNLNLYLRNSNVLPLIQFGAGSNGSYPTFFTGLGFRFNSPPMRRIAISGGVASTWVRTLDKLKVGVVVTSDADLENDLQFQFNWPPKPYIAIQVNF